MKEFAPPVGPVTAGTGGGVVSTVKACWAAALVLPAKSIATTRKMCGASPSDDVVKVPPSQGVAGEGLSMLHLKPTAPAALNVNEGAVAVVGPVGPPVMSGTGGGAVSVTVTVRLSEAGFPALSAALHVTGVDPRLNGDPDKGEHEKLAMPEPVPSEAVAK